MLRCVVLYFIVLRCVVLCYALRCVLTSMSSVVLCSQAWQSVVQGCGQVSMRTDDAAIEPPVSVAEAGDAADSSNSRLCQRTVALR